MVEHRRRTDPDPAGLGMATFMQWEYLCVDHRIAWAINDKPEESLKGKTHTEVLNILGEHGWELVSVANTTTGFFKMYLKRPRR